MPPEIWCQGGAGSPAGRATTGRAIATLQSQARSRVLDVALNYLLLFQTSTLMSGAIFPLKIGERIKELYVYTIRSK